MRGARASAVGVAMVTVLAGSTACGASTPAHRPAGPVSAASTTAASVRPTSGATSTPSAAVSAATAVRPAHVVVVVMENHSYADVIGSSQAPYINALARHGISLTRMYGITHPSEPNYLALFSGSTHGLSDDRCPLTYTSADLGSTLRAHHYSFVGYSEGLPYVGSKICNSGAYARRHAPWTDFTDLPSYVNRPLSTLPSDYSRLATVSFVIPNVNNDMHDGTVHQGDVWLQQHLSAYYRWALTHNSLLVVTWDEDDRSASNQIPTVIVGSGVAARRLSTHYNHYGLLRALEDAYGLPRLGYSASAAPVPLH